MSKTRQVESGFTLLELMITVAVLAILIAVGGPSMLRAAEKRETVSATEEIYSQLQFARSEAVARSDEVFANIVAGAGWAIGVSDNAGCDPSDNMPACTLAEIPAGNDVTYLFSAADFDDISVATTANQITFSPQRATASAATIDVTSTGRVGYRMRVVVGVLGQISICSPNANPVTFVSGYRPC
jgi:type IV fimbrial biogenesis protein FimT